MSSFTYLITKEDIEWLDDYDDNKVSAIIKDVQRTSIRPLFPNFYNFLIERVENGTLSMQDEHVIEEYIKPIMSLLCENELYIKSEFKIVNTGTAIEVSNEFDRASGSQKQFIINQNKEKAKIHEVSMLQYLNENKSIFPSYMEDFPDVDVSESMGFTTVGGTYSQSTIYRTRRNEF